MGLEPLVDLSFFSALFSGGRLSGRWPSLTHWVFHMCENENQTPPLEEPKGLKVPGSNMGKY